MLSFYLTFFFLFDQSLNFSQYKECKSNRANLTAIHASFTQCKLSHGKTWLGKALPPQIHRTLLKQQQIIKIFLTGEAERSPRDFLKNYLNTEQEADTTNFLGNVQEDVNIPPIGVGSQGIHYANGFTKVPISFFLQEPFVSPPCCRLAESTPSTACQSLTHNVGFVYVSINISQFKTGAVPGTNRMEYSQAISGSSAHYEGSSQQSHSNKHRGWRGSCGGLYVKQVSLWGRFPWLIAQVQEQQKGFVVQGKPLLAGHLPRHQLLISA